MDYKMKLHSKPFEMINEGIKTVELRLNDEKKKSIKIGDYISFENIDNPKFTIDTKVVNVYKFNSFDELYSYFPHSMIGYENDLEGHPDDMLKYYSKEQQLQFGVLGIEIQAANFLTKKAIADIESKLGYTFNDKKLLEQAFTRKAVSKNGENKNNEIMEFLGDSIIGYVITKMIVSMHTIKDEYSLKEEISEGSMSQLRSFLVENVNLSANIDQFKLEEYLLLSKNEKIRDSYKSDLVESIVGAVAIDSNYNQEELYEIVDVLLAPRSYIRGIGFKEYLNLKEWFKIRGVKEPKPIIKRNNASEYEVLLKFDKYSIIGLAQSKIDAIFDASKKAMLEIKRNNDHITVKDFLGGLNEHNGKRYLNNLKRNEYIKNIEFGEEKLENGDWKVTLYIDWFYIWCTNKSKITAIKICSLIAINSLLNRRFQIDDLIKPLLEKLGYNE